MNRRDDLLKRMNSFRTSSTEVALTAIAGFMGDLVTELEEKDKLIEALNDHIETLKK